MNTGYLSIYLSLLYFMSTTFCRFYFILFIYLFFYMDQHLSSGVKIMILRRQRPNWARTSKRSLRHIGTFRANEQRRAQSPDGAPEPIAAAAAAAAAAAVRPAPARRRRRLGPL